MPQYWFTIRVYSVVTRFVYIYFHSCFPALLIQIPREARCFDIYIYDQFWRELFTKILLFNIMEHTMDVSVSESCVTMYIFSTTKDGILAARLWYASYKHNSTSKSAWQALLISWVQFFFLQTIYHATYCWIWIEIVLTHGVSVLCPHRGRNYEVSWAPSQYKDRLIYVWRFPC